MSRVKESEMYDYYCSKCSKLLVGLCTKDASVFHIPCQRNNFYDEKLVAKNLSSKSRKPSSKS